MCGRAVMILPEEPEADELYNANYVNNNMQISYKMKHLTI
jgi:hypothetical protein